MDLRWTDVIEIAIELDETYPDIDPTYIRFTDLMEKVMSLEDFHQNEEHCGEKILEAIQMAWIEERE
ncbi:MAG: Fe-S cluster assembly protein IscX [Pseudomonadota bacterium]